jgi:chorismate-pyruvate lyase
VIQSLLLVAQLATTQMLREELLRTRSATATLEQWCRDQRLADPPRIVAHLVARAAKRPSAEQLKRLAVTSEHDVKFRHVQLTCGTHVLSEADNWYVPSRLTPEMNRLLETTDTPFGKAVGSLEPTRKTIDTKTASASFEIRAVLYTRDRRPFSEVDEVYVLR